MRLGKRRIQFKRLRCMPLRSGKRVARSDIAQIAQRRIRIREPGIGGRKPWVNVDGALEALYGPLQTFLRSLIPIVAALKIGTVCVRFLGNRSNRAVGTPGREAFATRARSLAAQGTALRFAS